MQDVFTPWLGYGPENAARKEETADCRRKEQSETAAACRRGEQAKGTTACGNREQPETVAACRKEEQTTENNSAGKGKRTDSRTREEEERIKENGQLTLGGEMKGRIHLLSVIGEIEGHENLSGSMKTTKYEHILPELARVEDDKEIEGVLVLINTVGGDVSCGLALAEMLASLSKPSVSLVIGDSHSIGVPLAVATDYSFIVPTGTMMIHPVRMTGMVIGAVQTYDYFEMIQDRILSFVSSHSGISYEDLKGLMHNTKMLTKDLGTVLVGKAAVEQGLINEVGGIREALGKLYEMIDK